ncbi:unnamed protein product [Meganyctiphanes norvegica]|uniref:MACPF domain-containing protein n=1 Tax=Meganyctiphanes norvegica TaxID=48144 RepID=A0AAV2Q5C1_MEGNR
MGLGSGPQVAALLMAVCILCGEGGKRNGSHRTRNTDYQDENDGNITVGKTVNLLPRYGFLTLSIKVFPHRTDNGWLFRESMMDVFQKSSYWTATTIPGAHGRHRRRRRRPQYDQHFLIDFCDNARDLMNVYFDNFHIEGVPEPHQAFTSSLSPKVIAHHLGIHATFLSDEYAFVLVRLFKRARRATLAGDLTLSSEFKSALSGIRIGSAESVHQFIDKFGTHVITEYEVGDVMYQVYVFGEHTYRELKSNFALSQSSQSHDEPGEMTWMERYFTPYYALNVGRVKLASGNPEFDNVVGNELVSMTFFRLYQSIFAIFKHYDLEEQLEQLEGEVILSLKLEKITKIVPKSAKRHWLREVLDNTLSLYYVTM